jgi:hypothetical protein
MLCDESILSRDREGRWGVRDEGVSIARLSLQRTVSSVFTGTRYRTAFTPSFRFKNPGVGLIQG